MPGDSVQAERRRPTFEELEERILFSADAAALLDAAHAPVNETRLIDTTGEYSAPTNAAAAQQLRHEVVFVDTATPDYQKLLDDIRGNAGGTRQIDVVLLDSASDGIKQIGDALAQRSDVDAVHVISHGSDGAIQLGNSTLDFDSLLKNAAQIKGWGEALNADADILIYGCDVAQSADGKALVDALARLTGADVAASENLTGGAAQHGDWMLEYQDGAIETGVAVSQALQLDWDHTLATFIVSTTADSGVGSLRDAITNANANGSAVTDVIQFAIGSGVQTINLTSALPNINTPVTIDGTTQPGYAGTPLIVLNGASAGAGVNGLNLVANNSTVKGLVINQFNGHGIAISGNNNVVVGNYIGTDQTGSLDRGNARNAIEITGGSNTVGGTNAADRNVLSGNDESGLWIHHGSANSNVIQGNYIGVNAAGNAALANTLDGMVISDPGASNNLIGGTAAGAANVISGNANYGIAMGYGTGGGNRIEGNLIGTDATGTSNIGNAIAGVQLINDAGNTIGGTTLGAGNLIAYNGGDAIEITGTSSGNLVSSNRTHSNGGLSIDLNADGVTANDAGDADSGANNAQNFPVLTTVLTNGSQVFVTGSLNSTASRNYRVEFFASAAGLADGTGHGEAQRYLGFATVTTDGSGNATISTTLTAAVSAGEIVTASAIDQTTNDTSELATNIAAVQTRTISGTVYEDVNGDGNLSDGVGVSGVTVNLYADTNANGAIDAGDALVTSTTTAAGGAYSFNLNNGTYWVVIDSKTIAPSSGYNASFGIGDVWAEQTYGSTGAASGASFLGSAGTLYGGRYAAVSDDAAAVTTAEHVTRVTVAGANVSSIDSAFSFNAITTTRDGDDDASARSIQGSLRQFIQNANAMSGAQSSNFSIGSGAQSIALASALPTISQGVTLDATTQEGFSGTPLIELNGAGAGGVDGLTIGGSGTTVRGFVINRFDSGIAITGTGNTVVGNYIGLDATGQSNLGNTNYGVRVDASSNTIGGTSAADRNVIAGNAVNVLLNASADNNIVRGNYIGFDNTGATLVGASSANVLVYGDNNLIGGTAAGAGNVIGGGSYGVDVESGSDGAIIRGNVLGLTAAGNAAAGSSYGVRLSGTNATVGGTSANARNIISGNTVSGVYLIGAGTSGNLVQGNYIGTDATGAIAIGNTSYGIEIVFGAAGNTIGGSAPGAGNLISGNGQEGIEIAGSGTSNNVLLGNYIGVNAAGNAALGNGGSGIRVENSATANTIGGSAGGAGNVISGNALDGIFLAGASTSSNVMLGNLIGLNAAGNGAIGNGLSGIVIAAGASNNTIGSTAAGAANIISANQIGIEIDNASTGNAISGNSIFGNNALGIDLNNDGVSAPDGATNASLPNLDIDSAVIQTATLAAGVLTLAGYAGNTPSSATFAGTRIEFFIADNDASGYGEGRTYLGFLTADGNSQFSGTLNVAGLNVGDNITATVTDGAGNTSEFSLNYTVTLPSAAPVNTVPGTQTTTEDNGTTITGISVNDVNGDLSTVALSVLHGAVSVNLSGGATISAGANGSAGLTLSGTQTQINAALASVSYAPTANFNGSDTLSVLSTDAAAQGTTDTVTINVTSINDAPAGTDNTVSAVEDTAYVFGTADFGFTDPNDSPANALSAVTITTVPGAGSFTLSGVAVTAGQSISAANITAGNLRFTPALGASGNGYASFTFQVQDDGGTAGGGIDLDATPNTITINVGGLNDAPAGTDHTATTLEDTAYVFTGGDFGFTDPNDSPANALSAVTITTVPGAGSLTLSGVAVTAGQSISAANISAGNLRFTPSANANGSGYTSFTFQVQDDGGTAGGGVDLDATPNTMTIDVTAVNDAPTGAGNTVNTNEDTAYTFAAIDFGFADAADSPANSLTAVRIGTLPGAGSLTLSGAAVTAGQSIVLADITAGNLRFTPSANANGAGYASFTFRVQDDGGTANGGVNLATAAATMTVNVAAVNDAPVLTRSTLTLTQGATVTLSSNELAATDIDTASGSLMFTVSGVTHGRFALAGNPAAAILTFSQAQVSGGQIVFVHDASGSAPAFAVSVSDGALATAPVAAAINFNPASIVPPGPVIVAPAGSDTGSSSGDSSEPVEVFSTKAARGGGGAGHAELGAGDDAGAATHTPSADVVAAPDNLASATAPAVSVFASAPSAADAHLNRNTLHEGDFVAPPPVMVLPPAPEPSPAQLMFSSATERGWSAGTVSSEVMQHVSREERQLNVLLDSAQFGGIALSVGVVWWATRVGGLIGSLLASMPAWRNIDPLHVIGNNPSAEAGGQWEGQVDMDTAADEIAIAMVLDGPDELMSAPARAPIKIPPTSAQKKAWRMSV